MSVRPYKCFCRMDSYTEGNQVSAVKLSYNIYSDLYNIILLCTSMCYNPHSTCDGSIICCMYYFNPDLKKQDQLPE